MKKIIRLIPILALAVSCKKDAEVSGTTVTTTTPAAIPAVYNKIFGASSVTSDGTYITVKTKGVPSHKSCYWPTSNALYQAFATGSPTFNGETFQKAPNEITEQNFTFKIPLKPALNSSHAATPMGPIGFALDGVPLFNQYAAGGVALGNEKKGFDQYYGHPQMTGSYHYHVEPIYITLVKSTQSALVGFLLDGFPVYGPEENGATVAESALDTYHGHTAEQIALADIHGSAPGNCWVEKS